MPNEKSINSLLGAIASEAEAEKEKIKYETGKFVEKQINDAEKDALAESYDLIRSETLKVRSDYGKAVTAKRIELGNRMLLDRNNIKDAVFSNVKERILKFKASDDYKKFLLKSFEQCTAALGGDSFTVSFSKDDLPLAETLKASGIDFDAVCDDSIKLGGIKVMSSDGKLTADDTLDTRLASEAEWFEKNSGLVIRKA